MKKQLIITTMILAILVLSIAEAGFIYENKEDLPLYCTKLIDFSTNTLENSIIDQKDINVEKLKEAKEHTWKWLEKALKRKYLPEKEQLTYIPIKSPAHKNCDMLYARYEKDNTVFQVFSISVRMYLLIEEKDKEVNSEIQTKEDAVKTMSIFADTYFNDTETLMNFIQTSMEAIKKSPAPEKGVSIKCKPPEWAMALYYWTDGKKILIDCMNEDNSVPIVKFLDYNWVTNTTNNNENSVYKMRPIEFVE
jgi:disulfide oxidoreductase YuzD